MRLSEKGIIRMFITGAVVLALIVGLFVFTERVPEGKVAVVYTPSEGATEVLDAGWHLIGLLEKTQQYPTRIQVVKDKVSVSTNDGKKVTMEARYEYKVDKTKVLSIFKELGSQNIEGIQSGYLYNKLFKASRETIANFSLLDVYGTKTTEASAQITEKFAKTSEGLGFIITDVTLGTPKADKATQQAIDARVQASQALEKKKIDIELAESESERQRVEAEGVANAEIERARGDAEANRLIQQSITPELLKKMELDARMKHGWVTIQGATPLIEAK